MKVGTLGDEVDPLPVKARKIVPDHF